MQLFQGTVLLLEDFCQQFSNLLLTSPLISTETKDIITVILQGVSRDEIVINPTTGHQMIITEYYLNDVFKFKLSQIQTNNILNQFKLIEAKFQQEYGLQLIVARQYSIKFFIGQTIPYISPINVKSLRLDEVIENQVKLFLNNPNILVEIYILN